MQQQLEKKLSEILQLATEFRSYYATNEIAVREQLINPILNILGWNTANPNFVRHNAPNDLGKIPDYTLLKLKKNVLVVEAKNLTVELKDDKIISQLAGYSYNMGISFGILTNGIKWLLFNTFQRNPSERVVWIADLEKDDTNFGNTIKKLITISYDNIEKLESSIQTIMLLESTWTTVCPTSQDLVKLVSSFVRDKVNTENPNFLIDFSDIENFVEGKISELFDITTPIKAQQDTGKAEIATSEGQTGLTNTKKTKTLIKVTFTDNTSIYEKKASETFVKTIEKIGIDRVKLLGLTLNGLPLIDNQKNANYQQYEVKKGVFVMVHSDTKNKISRLQEISDRLNLNLKVETVEWKPQA
ncbi:type I restriction enzyme HsdR N-terminal domain-containing protein [Hugenholtzia roseola]|uniref:type I restriction enzyme HsdR N-terminal domain-containing protein n=1 Tax=Hugenholtzia roseola TaxID=1002 RepID=UPI0004262EB6|nr:type I restriction enzyme HsdR N-terminal domain-containing protein [Hugenholtzia roseola]